MALTVDKVEYTVFGNKSIVFCEVGFDSSYPTGGEALTPETVGLTNIEMVMAHPKSGYLFEYDYTNELLKAYYPSAAEESHTHAILLDSGASGAEAAHTHAVALDSGSSGAEAAHTHAVLLDTGASGAEAAHTHAVALDSGASAAGSAHQHAAITAGTPAGTNAASVVTPGSHATVDGVTVGTPALTHNADPVTNLAAAALYIVEAYGAGNKNIGVLQSACAGTTSILGSTDDVSGACGAATPRFFVTHNASPAGVAIYVDETDNDKLVFVSPTEADAVVIMPFEAIADGIPGYAYAVTVHHKASMTGSTALYFDDNGAADAQLIFVDTGTAGGVIYASDIEVVAPQYTGITGNCGAAAAQTFSGSELATHQHATENAHTHASGTLADAASGVGSSHTHGPGTLADAASGAGSSHTHGAGSLADAASGTGSSHTHASGTLADAASGTATGTAGVGTEVTALTDLSSVADVKVMIIGH